MNRYYEHFYIICIKITNTIGRRRTKWNRLGKFITGAAIGGLIGIGAILLFAPDKRDEWFDEIQEKTQDILVELIGRHKNI